MGKWSCDSIIALPQNWLGVLSKTIFKKSDHRILSSKNSKTKSPFRRQFFVTPTIRHTQIPALLVSWVTDTHHVNVSTKILLPFICSSSSKAKVFLCVSRPALDPTQLPIQYVEAPFCGKKKRPGLEFDHLTPLIPTS